MKRTKLHRSFEKSYKSRILNNPKLLRLVEARINLFLKDRNNPILKDHTLKGKMTSKRSFSVANDLRIIYLEYEDYYLFLDIGTHNQVY